MQYRPLGPAGPDVSAVGFGGMHLSIVDRPDEATAIRVIHAALDAGITLLDTADVYCLDDREIGHNERLMARALREWRGPRDEVIVATKGGMTRPDGRWGRNGRPRHLRAACERSLRALGVEAIALYQLHAPDPDVPFEESVGALADLMGEGKILRLGVSNVSVEQIEAAGRIAPVTTVQNRLNPFFPEARDEGVVAHCAEKCIGFLAYSPTGGGRLTKKLPGHPVVQAVARRIGASPHAVVIAWVRAQGPTVIPIPGARKPEHAVDSAGVADLELGDGDIEELSAAEFDRS